ncbi:NeuD/PglB/VioB family sugar acetyltransferase [Gammaproteobacteria bacterium]|nr:NeuD/PglB/VioB family sugar acetyltransferase [Gammaproteobacteria bacterium]
MKKIILVGGGGHCMSCIDVVEASGAFEIIGFVDNASSAQLSQEIRFLGSDKDLPDLYKDEHCALVTVGQIKTSETRKKIFNLLQSLNFIIPTIVSPNSVIAKNSTIKEGTIVMHQCVINACASVGKNCIINTKALLEHEVIVHSHCHISTGAIVNGGAIIDGGSFIGSGSVIFEGIKIGANSIISAGSIVRKDLPANSFFKG